MKKAILYTVGLDMIFIFFLALAGSFGSPLSEIFRYSGYVTVFVLFLFIYKKAGVKKHTLAPLPTREGALLTLPLAAPTLLAVMGISALTAYIMSLLGKSSATGLDGSFFVLFLLHALLPAVLEELLFRFIPITLIAPHSKKCAILLSALFFALAHCNLFQIPYALFAGAVFAFVTLMTGSVLPSVLLHLLNNTSSIIWQRGLWCSEYAWYFIIGLSALALISCVCVFLVRNRYKPHFRACFDKEDKLVFTREAALYTVMTLLISALALI